MLRGASHLGICLGLPPEGESRCRRGLACLLLPSLLFFLSLSFPPFLNGTFFDAPAPAAAATAAKHPSPVTSPRAAIGWALTRAPCSSRLAWAGRARNSHARAGSLQAKRAARSEPSNTTGRTSAGKQAVSPQARLLSPLLGGAASPVDFCLPSHNRLRPPSTRQG